MPEGYSQAILKYMADKEYQPLKEKQLARIMGVAENDFGTFRDAIKRLHDAGRVIMGAGSSLNLPAMPARVVGVYRRNPKGFGFVSTDTPYAQGDLFIPPDGSGGAMSGDRVVAKARKQGKRDGETLYRGQIIEILNRASGKFVGEVKCAKGIWFVVPDGRQLSQPIIIRDIGAAGPKEGTKVVVEITKYPDKGDLPEGVIVSAIGPAGPLDTETRAVILAHGMEEEFPEQAIADARLALEAFDADKTDGREDITDVTIVTIDPPDARDFDDAISLVDNADGTCTLGVHIADVSHFVTEGTALDLEAARRATSVYFPRKVLPMLPEILSNGVCSLQEGQRRFCKSAFITYDQDANVVSTRLAETVICSSKRLTYIEAQEICDGKTGGFPKKVAELVKQMEALSKRIMVRREASGMLRLDLGSVELVIDDNNRVTDVEPEDTSYTHTLIEMFMVEANEAVAEIFGKMSVPVLRRIHPAPETRSSARLNAFIKASGHRIPKDASRRDFQQLIEEVRGTPASHAVNLALLKTMQAAEYSPMLIGHYALASEAYCHFTSPIRRYADLSVHRLVRSHCRGELEKGSIPSVSDLVALGEHCSEMSQEAESAERELKTVLIMQLLKTHVGDTMEGVISGVNNVGTFVSLTHWGIDGLVRVDMLGDDWWEVNTSLGIITGQHTGITYRMGELVQVQLVSVDVPSRQIDLRMVRKMDSPSTGKSGKSRKSGGTRKNSGGKGKGKGKTATGGKTGGRKTTRAKSSRKASSATKSRKSGRKRK